MGVKLDCQFRIFGQAVSVHLLLVKFGFTVIFCYKSPALEIKLSACNIPDHRYINFMLKNANIQKNEIGYMKRGKKWHPSQFH